MTTLGQTRSNNTFFRGISSFWSRFFKDKAMLATLSAATDQLMSQVYLEMLEALLANSFKTVPVFSKEFWKLLTFNSSEVVIDGTEYRFSLPDKIREANFIYNKIFEPSTVLEVNQDFRIDNGYIYFKKNIFDDLEYTGFAKRRQSGSTIISMWMPDALVDKEYVYEYFGRMLEIYEPSSEGYRSFIQGIWFYYMNGPTKNRIKSAMNIIGGYPVASEDGEVVLSIKHIGSTYYIKTTVSVYEVPDNVGLEISVGDTLSAFQALTSAYEVVEYLDDPHWFDHIVVPLDVFPTLSVEERTTDYMDSSVIFVGYPILIGDPRWKVGMGGLPNFMWLFFNAVLKYNIFYITYDALASRFVRSTDDLPNIVLSGKPAYDLAIVMPYFTVEDTVGEATDLLISMEVSFNLTDQYNLNTLIEDLIQDLIFRIPQESYGKVPISFGDPPTLIGQGVVGNPPARLASGVPEWVGINTIGLTDSGLYTEFPIEIVAT